VKLYTVLFKGKERPAIEKDGALYEVIGFKDMNDLIEGFAPGSEDSLSLGAAISDYTLLSPIVHPRQDIMCLGINYSDHAEEAGKFSKEAFGGERPYTIYFAKRCSEAIGPGALIPSYPGYVDSLDYEVELGVVLGKDAKNVKPAEALKYVFGYTVFNDISARNLQTRHKQWYVGKSLDGFTAMGPCIVTPDELGDIYALGIRCFVNGELRQNSITSRMIQTIEGAIAELSQGITLKAGTVIAMGTPSGVGMGMDPPTFLKPGDVVRCEIDGIGVLENTVE
jgi:2-keto-4-pentenoate hydratase/2-oxohepta-3-ene-1,7-dioic acid hydratase in catechol pathway